MQAAMIQPPPRLAFQAVDDIFVSHIQDRIRRQHRLPVVHQVRIDAIKPAEFPNIVSVAQLAGERFGEA